MVPGISPEAEASLTLALDPAVTDLTLADLQAQEYHLFDGQDAEAQALGITASGPLTVVVTDPDRPLGTIRVQCGGRDNVVFFDNRSWGGNMYASIRMLGAGSLAYFCDVGDQYVALQDIYLRSHNQLLFWGRGSSAVGCSMEIDGTGASVVVGDDALISGGVWIRNHDMHAIHDLTTGAAIGRPAVNTVLERHVWLGQDAMLLQTERVGMGAIVGARALVKGRVPPRVAVAGTPARVIRENISWGRDLTGMTEVERRAMGLGGG